MPATVFVKWDYGLAQMETTSSGSTHLVPVADKVLVFSAGNRACRGTTILHKTTNAILEMALHKIIDYVTLVCSALLVRYISANIANFFASNGPSGAPPPGALRVSCGVRQTPRARVALHATGLLPILLSAAQDYECYRRRCTRR